MDLIAQLMSQCRMGWSRVSFEAKRLAILILPFELVEAGNSVDQFS